MKQSSFSDLAYEHKKKTTRKERFLKEMDAILPWDKLLKPILEEVSQTRSGPASHSGGGDVTDLLSATVVWIE